MSDTQHTPGPWEWSEDKWRGGYSGLYGPNGEDVVVPQHCNDGDDGAAWFDDEVLTEPNARLIAAAPDLLAACELAVKNAERAIGDPAMFLPIRFACQAAVGKAKPKGGDAEECGSTVAEPAPQAATPEQPPYCTCAATDTEKHLPGCDLDMQDSSPTLSAKEIEDVVAQVRELITTDVIIEAVLNSTAFGTLNKSVENMRKHIEGSDILGSSGSAG